jgi:hypothetical protein
LQIVASSTFEKYDENVECWMHCLNELGASCAHGFQLLGEESKEKEVLMFMPLL